QPPIRPEPDERPRPRRLVRVLFGSVVASIVSCGAAFALDAATRDHLMPGTRIGGVLVGGRSIADAEGLLERTFVAPLHDPIRLEAAGASVTVAPWDLGMRIDTDGVLRRTHARQQALPLVERAWKRISGDPRDVALGSYIEEGALRRRLGQVAATVDRPVRDASLELLEDGSLRIVPDEFGRRLDVEHAAPRIAEALRAGARSVDLPVHLTQPERTAADFRQVILIRTRSNTLDLYEDGKVARAYRVATGTGGYPTPAGLFRITAMRRNPSWGNPGTPWAANLPPYIPPGRNNPLGTRAMNLSVSGIRIHGTPEANSIGSNASHGCIRMHMREAEELFELVKVGTPVLIVRA
ncbi:MAG: L,D-transpeptidase family protein, partial [Candidatus Binatia bacterium]